MEPIYILTAIYLLAGEPYHIKTYLFGTEDACVGTQALVLNAADRSKVFASCTPAMLDVDGNVLRMNDLRYVLGQRS